MPPATPVPAQQKLTALNFGKKILLSCLLDSLSQRWELIRLLIMQGLLSGLSLPLFQFGVYL